MDPHWLFCLPVSFLCPARLRAAAVPTQAGCADRILYSPAVAIGEDDTLIQDIITHQLLKTQLLCSPKVMGKKTFHL